MLASVTTADVPLSSVLVAVAGEHRTLTEAVAAALHAVDPFEVTAFSSTSPGPELLAPGSTPHVLVLLAATGIGPAVEGCARLKTGPFDGKIVIVGPADDHRALLSAVRAGADGFVADDEPLSALCEAILTVHHGEARIPRGMLGTLLSSLIDARREDDIARAKYRALSQREREVLALSVRGWDAPRIAEQLFVSPHTVRTHMQNVFTKLDLHSRTEVVAFVLDHELLEVDADDRRAGA